MKQVIAVFFLATTFLTTHVSAGPKADTLKVCLTDNTTEKDKKSLIQWTIAVFSNHPEMRAITFIPPEFHENANKNMAAVTSRLLLEDCKDEARNAVQAEGQQAIRQAFEYLGIVAGQELMMNPVVQAKTADYVKYLDKAKINALFSN